MTFLPNFVAAHSEKPILKNTLMAALLYLFATMLTACACNRLLSHNSYSYQHNLYTVHLYQLQQKLETRSPSAENKARTTILVREQQLPPSTNRRAGAPTSVRVLSQLCFTMLAAYTYDYITQLAFLRTQFHHATVHLHGRPRVSVTGKLPWCFAYQNSTLILFRW